MGNVKRPDIIFSRHDIALFRIFLKNNVFNVDLIKYFFIEELKEKYKDVSTSVSNVDGNEYKIELTDDVYYTSIIYHYPLIDSAMYSVMVCDDVDHLVKENCKRSDRNFTIYHGIKFQNPLLPVSLLYSAQIISHLKKHTLYINL